MNDALPHDEIRVVYKPEIDSDGDGDGSNDEEQSGLREGVAFTGVMSTADALVFARSIGLDVVEVARNAKPPTCKIMDFSKHLFNQSKQVADASRVKKAKGNSSKVCCAFFSSRRTIMSA